MDEAKACLTLASAKGLGPRKFKRLAGQFGSAEAVLSATRSELLALEGVGPGLVKAIQSVTGDWAEQEAARARKLGVTLIPMTSGAYPAALRAIFDPPPVLYVRGQLPDALQGEFQSVQGLGVVGTRDASDYALKFTERLSCALAEGGVVISSGLALGVDTAAHQGALAGKGQTVAVLGSGVDVIYPQQNIQLAQSITDGRGAVVSEYALGTRPDARHFPARNRIISGLSRGVVVVEAGKRSGALITADYALEEGRTVLAVPGRAGDPRSKGALELLKQGAVLVQDMQDVLEEFGWQAQPRMTSPPVDLSPLQTQLYNAIQKRDKPLLDDLIQATGKSATVLLPQLGLLELKGLIATAPGGRYICL